MLDRRIEVYTLTETLVKGAMNIDQVLLRTLWAKVDNTTPSGKGYQAERKQAIDTNIFTIRYGGNEDIQPTMTLRYNNEVFTILSIQEAVRYGRRVAFEIVAQIKK